MSNTVIKVEGLGKQYRLGEIGTGTLSHDLNRWWARMRGKEDPFAKIGEQNDRTVKGSSDYVWALRDVDFEVKQGEVLGIIGRNGAGKSTLLKILSKVTRPSTGHIKTRGRIASLLEVGTGFHPEMTGRENIFMNGAILGMRKAEIRSKFDQIVDFAGVERYIDTPVKRYSSGMYVRLAFAVAAFLEPEILIVDEVLAVGDAEFQKKCLGRMKDVSVNDGRTVLFVSHNMAAIQQLCSTALLLKNGMVECSGLITPTVDAYTSSLTNTYSSAYFNSETKRSGNKAVQFEWIKITDDLNNQRNEFSVGENIFFNFSIHNNFSEKRVSLGMQVRAADGMPVFHILDSDVQFYPVLKNEQEKFVVCLSDIRLYPGIYTVALTAYNASGHQAYDHINDAISFLILDGGKYTSRNLVRAAGLFFVTPQWRQV